MIFAIVAQAFSASLSPWRPEFSPRAVHMGFLVDKPALAMVSLQVLGLSPVTTIPPMFHTHISFS